MPFSRLLKKLGAWTTLMKWNEPFFYRSRLRRDLGTRLAIAFGCGAVTMAVMLMLLAIQTRPLNALHGSLWSMVLMGGLAFLFLLRGKSTAGGRVRICEEGIIRSRQYVGIGAQWVEDSSWQYDGLRACAIVPGSSIGHSFSLLLLATDQGLDLIGIPASKDLQQIAATLNGRGVQPQIAGEIPQSLRKPMPPVVGILAAGMGCMALLVGVVGFVVASHWVDRDVPRDVAVHQLPQRHQDPAQPDAANGAAPLPGLAPVSPVVPPPADVGASTPGGELPPSSTPPPHTTAPPVPAMPRPSFPGLPRPPTFPGVPSIPKGLPPGTPAPAVTPPRTPKPLAAGTPTELVGSPHGSPFEHAVPEGAAVVGFRYLLARWNDRPAFAQFYPLDSRVSGNTRSSVVAKDGYAVGGIQVVTGERVEAIRVVFVRQTDDGLDKSDFYFSDWIGAVGSGTPTTIGNGSVPVVGVCGRRGAMVEAVGLLLRKE